MVNASQPPPPPRTTSLYPSSPPQLPTPPPPPPSLPPRHSFPFPPSALDPPDDSQTGDLPTYDQAAASSPARFKRWAGEGGWINKRARERREEREEESRMGRVKKGGWDLDDSEGRRGDRGEEGAGGGRWGGQAESGVETVRPETERLSLYDPAAWEQQHDGAGGNGQGKGKGKATDRSAGFQRLTKNVALHRVGGRFSRGIPERPMCGVGLPTQGGGGGEERFVLVGTEEGLHLIDLVPSLSTSHTRLSTASPSASTAPGAADDAVVLPLWTGLPVRQLEVYSDPSTLSEGRGEGPKGIVLALVGKEGEAEVRMWSLASLVQLAQWRVYDQNSVPLDLPRLTNTLHRRSLSLAVSQGPSGSSPCPSSPVDRRRTYGYDISPTSSKKGKGLSVSHVAIPAVVRPARTDAEYLLVDSFPSPSSPAGRPSHPSGLPFPSSPASTPAADDLDRLSLPLEWATTSVPLPLPAHGSGGGGGGGGKSKDGRPGVVFFRLFRMPPPANSSAYEESRADDEDDEEEEEEEFEEDLPAAERRRREEARQERGRLFLFVATKGSVFLFGSKPPAAGGGGRRSWGLTKEFFAPSTPRALHLLRLASPSPSSHSPSRSSSSSTSTSPSYPPDLHLLLLTSHRLVLINLLTSSVTELSLFLPSLHGGVSSLAASTSTSTSARMSRARSGSAGSTTSASSLSFTSSGRHRPSSSLANLSASLKDSLRDSAVLAKVQAFVEAKSGAVPVGMRGGEMEGVVRGRKRSEASEKKGDYGAREEIALGAAAAAAAAAAAGAAGGGKWTACEEVVVPSTLFPSSGSSSRRRRKGQQDDQSRRLLLLTKGQATYLFPLPLSLSSTSPNDGNHPSNLVPLWTFHWPSTSPSSSTGLVTKTVTTLSPLFNGGDNNARAAHLSVTAFTSTGLSVQEGLVSLSALAGAFAPSCSSSLPAPAREHEPFFRPLPLVSPTSPVAGPSSPPYPEAAPAAQEGDEEEDDLTSSATLDFGRETGWLCSSSSSSSASSGVGEGGGAAFFFTRAHSDYAVKRVRVGVPSYP